MKEAIINTFNEFASNLLVAVDSRDLITVSKLKESIKLLDQLLANGDAKVTLCTTVETEPTSAEESVIAGQLYRLKQDVIEQGLNDCAAEFSDNIECSTIMLTGKVFLAITRQVVIGGYDALICVRRHDAHANGLSATEMHLARKCPGPVLFLDRQQNSTLKNVVVAVDRDVYGGGSASALAHDLVQVATKIAAVDAANLHIVHAWQPFGVELLGDPRHGFSNADVESYRAEQRASHDLWLKELTVSSAAPISSVDLITSLHLKEGTPEDVVLEVCERVNADLLLIGTVGITNVPGVLIGNVAETILNKAACSILAMKPRGFQTPITSD